MSIKRFLAVFTAVLVLLTGCGSGDADSSAVSAGAVATPEVTATEAATEVATEATSVPATSAVAVEDTASGTDTATDGTSRRAGFESLVGEGYDDESASCIVDGLFAITGSYNMTPDADDATNSELREMAMTCQGIEIPEAPIAVAPVSTLTIEEWQQNAGDLDPVDRADLYADVGYPPMTIDETLSYEAVLATADGDMRFELAADLAPITVNSFVSLANDGYFDGLTFHRVLEGFMAQGGDPTGSGSGGPGYVFPNESTPGIEFTVRGILAMANAGANTNGSQFFITFDEAEFLGGPNYTIFGRLVDGDDTLASVDLRDPGAAVDPGTIIESIRIEVS